MEPQESTYLDRSEWPTGPWADEPDRIEWRTHGFACLIVRNRMGALCGYVGVPEGHPWHGKDYKHESLSDVTAHGGLTFADKCQEGGKICHVPQPGEADSVWWLGFDCAHLGDTTPGLLKHFGGPRDYFESYKSVAYVRNEVNQLAEQARIFRA